MNKQGLEQQPKGQSDVGIQYNGEYVKHQVELLLKSEALNDYKFERNKQFGPVIIDFYCEIYRFAIVVDRDEDFYTDTSAVDPECQAEMEQMGIVVLRFRESEVLKNPHIVRRTIGFWLKDRELHYL